MSNETNIGHMEEEARKRKEKLKSLKNKKNEDTNESKQDEVVADLPKPIFRSYQPKDENLKEAQLPKIKPTEVIENVKEIIVSGKTEPVVDEVDLTSLAPRKPDWDLKRDIAKKLEKLEKRTERAIAELIRERLQGNKKEDLAAAVSAPAVSATGDDDEDS